MTEIEFIESIDCQFPYDAEDKWRSIIELGARISPNSAFMILHELCCFPSDMQIEPEAIQAMLKYWRDHFAHPLVSEVFPAAEAMIEGREFPVEETMRIMRSVSVYPDQYNALAIPYSACDDSEGKVEKLYKEIIASWRGVSNVSQKGENQ